MIEIVERWGGWAFPMHDYERLSKDPQVAAVGVIVDVEESDGSMSRQVVPPWDFEATPASIRRAAPGLGEHQSEVLAELR